MFLFGKTRAMDWDEKGEMSLDLPECLLYAAVEYFGCSFAPNKIFYHFFLSGMQESWGIKKNLVISWKKQINNFEVVWL